MSQPDYNFDKVNRASQACGPLVKWAIAQVRHRLTFHSFDSVQQINRETFVDEHST